MERFKVKKLDRRMNGYNKFSHRVTIHGPVIYQIASLLKLRGWLWDTFGASSELHLVGTSPIEWCWEPIDGESVPRLYLKGTALTQFLLSKEKFE